jgi:hypothetical protein
MKCLICGRPFQLFAKGVVCCGIIGALIVGKPTRFPAPMEGKAAEQVLRVSVMSTSTTSISSANSLQPITTLDATLPSTGALPGFTDVSSGSITGGTTTRPT